MKPFDIELAKAGAPVVTRDGRKARIICFDRKTVLRPCEPLGALISISEGEERFACYKLDGVYRDLPGSDNDLFMAPKKEKRWVVTWFDDGGIHSRVMNSEPAARALANEPGGLPGEIHEIEVTLP